MVQHAAIRSKENPLEMRDLQARAPTATPDGSLVKGLGQRFESARRLSFYAHLQEKPEKGRKPLF